MRKEAEQEIKPHFASHASTRPRLHAKLQDAIPDYRLLFHHSNTKYHPCKRWPADQGYPNPIILPKNRKNNNKKECPGQLHREYMLRYSWTVYILLLECL